MGGAYARLTTAVLAICIVSAGLLGFTEASMRERKDRLLAEYEAKLRGETLAGTVAGAEVTFPNPPRTVGEFEVYDGYRDGELIGEVFSVRAPVGYGGPITFLLGVTPDGQSLTGIRVTEHAETPGLGANAKEIKYGETDPWFCQQFAGLRLPEVALHKEVPTGKVDGLTGATITSKAITDAAYRAFSAYQVILASMETSEATHE